MSARTRIKRKTTDPLGKTRGRKGASADQTNARERLLTAGKRHFLEFGSHSLSVRKVASDAQVNLGSFVYHFGTKEEFIRHLITSHYEDLLSIFNSGIENAAPTSAPIERLRMLLGRMGTAAERHGDLVIRLMTEIAQGEKSVLLTLIESPPLHFHLIRATIEECQNRREIRGDLSSTQVFLVLAFCVGLPELLLKKHTGRFGRVGTQQIFKKILTDRFRLTRIDIALKGLAP